MRSLALSAPERPRLMSLATLVAVAAAGIFAGFAAPASACQPCPPFSRFAVLAHMHVGVPTNTKIRVAYSFFHSDQPVFDPLEVRIEDTGGNSIGGTWTRVQRDTPFPGTGPTTVFLEFVPASDFRGNSEYVVLDRYDGCQFNLHPCMSAGSDWEPWCAVPHSWRGLVPDWRRGLGQA